MSSHPRHIAAILATAALTASCVAPAPQPQEGAGTPGSPLDAGGSVRVVTIEGVEHPYRAHLPERLPDPAPLILLYHGLGGDAASIEQATGWIEYADREGFVLLSPEGVGRSFNAGGCCGDANTRAVDDVAAALAMIDDVSSSVPIDADRVYATGFSNGGHMSYRLACETDRFAAIAPVAGAQLVACDSPAPTSLLHIHGLADGSVPAEGETRPGGVVVPPTEDVAADWRTALSCEQTERSIEAERTTSTAACPGGRAVHLVTLETFGHSWPRAGDGLDATATIWEFFSRHRR